LELIEPLFAIAVNTPLAPVASAVFAARLTYSLLPYDRKLAAVKNVSGFKFVGLPKRLTKLSSLLIRTNLSIGPQRKTPAMAPSVVETAGTTVVRSISDTLTPGLT